MKFDSQTGELTIGGRSFQMDEYDEDAILWEPELVQIHDLTFSTSNFLDNLLIEIQSEDGFGTYLFHDLEIHKDENDLKLVFVCRQPNKYWEGTWGLSTLLGALNDTIQDSQGAIVETIDIESDWKELEVSFIVAEDFTLKEFVGECALKLKDLIKLTERILSGAVWRKEYEKDEALFCTEILYPLLRKMGYVDVRYTHGVKEYGKDFTFSEPTKFGNLRHFGLQAKAGDIKGSVNAQIDELLGQLDDAFSMPFFEVSANESRQISTFIIATSGRFTENAKEKIVNKMPKYFQGSVYFIDRDKTLELIEKYWK